MNEEKQMQQQTNAAGYLNPLALVPSPGKTITKTAIEKLVAYVIEDISAYGNVMNVAEEIAVRSLFMDTIRGNSKFIEAVREELTKHHGKYTTPAGVTLELAETGVKYSYEHDNEWQHCKKMEDFWVGKRKQREAILRMAPAGTEAAVEDTGEVIVGAGKSSVSNFKTTIQKYEQRDDKG